MDDNLLLKLKIRLDFSSLKNYSRYILYLLVKKAYLSSYITAKLTAFSTLNITN